MLKFGNNHMFSKSKIAELKARFASVDVNSIADSSLQAKARKLKKQAGFTLLELLVVVAILAAVAGTATIALKDTDARASAAAHVAMMDELNKGVITFRVLNKNVLPNNYDSLIQTAATSGATATAVSAAAASAFATAKLLEVSEFKDGGDGTLAMLTLNDSLAKQVAGGGTSQLRYASTDVSFDPADEGDCTSHADLINNKHNAVVAGNVFLSPEANGCGYSANVTVDGTGDTASTSLPVAVWTGGYERVLGTPGKAYDDGNFAVSGGSVTGGADGTPILMAVGFGPSSNLFNQNAIGGMTTVPVYRHVGKDTYNRFVGLFYIGEVSVVVSGSSTFYSEVSGNDNMHLVSVVDGAGDTKEEELGEWDGTRNTI